MAMPKTLNIRSSEKITQRGVMRNLFNMIDLALVGVFNFGMFG
jgi:hypothetical protein